MFDNQDPDDETTTTLHRMPVGSIGHGMHLLVLLAFCVVGVFTTLWLVPARRPSFSMQRVKGRVLLGKQILKSAEDYTWMWKDAGKNLFGHEVAEMDPSRWSAWRNAKGTIKNLLSYKSPENLSRPIEMLKGNSDANRLTFKNIDEAVQYLREHKGAAPESTTPHTTVPPQKKSNDNTTLPVVDTVAAIVAVASFVCLGYLAFRMITRCVQKRRAAGIYGDPGFDDAEFGSQNMNQASRSSFHEGECEALLAGIDREEAGTVNLEPILSPRREEKAIPGPVSDPTQRAEAEREVERILAIRNPCAIFNNGTKTERRSEFRRLVRMLHPDKQVVGGERANLALRRLVEAYRSMNAAE